MSGNLGFRNSTQRPTSSGVRRNPIRETSVTEDVDRNNELSVDMRDADASVPTKTRVGSRIISRKTDPNVFRTMHAAYCVACKNWVVVRGFVPLMVHSCIFLAAPLVYNSGATCFPSSAWANQTQPIAMHDYVTYNYSNSLTQAVVIVASALYAHFIISANDCRTWFNTVLFFHIGTEVKVVDTLLTYTREPSISSAYSALTIVALVVIVTHLVIFLVSDMRHLLSFVAFVGVVVNTASLVFLDPSQLLLVGLSSSMVLQTLLCIRGMCRVRTSILYALIEAMEHGTWFTMSSYHMMPPYNLGYADECALHGTNGCGKDEYCEACNEMEKMHAWYFEKVVDKSVAVPMGAPTSNRSRRPSIVYRETGDDRGDEDDVPNTTTKERASDNGGMYTMVSKTTTSMLRRVRQMRRRDNTSRGNDDNKNEDVEDNRRAMENAPDPPRRRFEGMRGGGRGSVERDGGGDRARNPSSYDRPSERGGEYTYANRMRDSATVEERLQRQQQRHSQSLPSRTRIYVPRSERNDN